jgi:hypothetical protein
MKKLYRIFSVVVAIAFSAAAQEAPTGTAVSPSDAEKGALGSLKGKITGTIVWSSSRSNSRHDLWAMNADGTGERQLTKGDNVDWFARISPDGSTVLFARSKFGWEAEGDADVFDKWDLYTVGIDGSGEKMAAENAVWGTWRPAGDSIVFARGPRVFIKALAGGAEKEIFDADKSIKKGTNAQQPSLSPDGRLLAVTLRGSKRDCGIWNLAKNEWISFGGGCQIAFFPDGKRIVRMNEGMGNGSTEILAFRIDADGKPVDKIALNDKVRFMDLTGRRSHEYFPKPDPSGQWLVWAATQTGHEHDIADYELYAWNITTDRKKGPVRLTFHSGNDRWPDLFLGEAKKAPVQPPADAGAAPQDSSGKK